MITSLCKCGTVSVEGLIRWTMDETQSDTILMNMIASILLIKFSFTAKLHSMYRLTKLNVNRKFSSFVKETNFH